LARGWGKAAARAWGVEAAMGAAPACVCLPRLSPLAALTGPDLARQATEARARASARRRPRLGLPASSAREAVAVVNYGSATAPADAKADGRCSRI